MIERFKNISPLERWQEYLQNYYSSHNKKQYLSRLSPNFEKNLIIRKLISKPHLYAYRFGRGKAEIEKSRAGYQGDNPKLFKAHVK